MERNHYRMPSLMALLVLPAALAAAGGQNPPPGQRGQDPPQQNQPPAQRQDNSVMEALNSFKSAHSELRHQMVQKLENLAQDKHVSIHAEQVSITSLDNNMLVVGAPTSGAGSMNPKEEPKGQPKGEPAKPPASDKPQNPGQPGARGEPRPGDGKDVIGILVVWMGESGGSAGRGSDGGGSAGASNASAAGIASPGTSGAGVQSGVYLIREAADGHSVQLIGDQNQVAATIMLEHGGRMGARNDADHPDRQEPGNHEPGGQKEPGSRPQNENPDNPQNPHVTGQAPAGAGKDKVSTDASQWEAVYVAILDHLTPG